MGNEQDKGIHVNPQNKDMVTNDSKINIPIDPTQKMEEKKKEKEKKVKRWCSWCWGRTIHQMKREGWLLERSTYECTGCNHETTTCIFCQTAMTRSYGHVADNLCLKCDGTFYNSHKKISRTEKNNFYCSWCFEKTNHTLFDKSLLGRDVYKCVNCQKTGSNCKSCSTALARDHGTTSDLYCIVCDGTLKSWELEEIEKIYENKNITLKKIHCGWCIERTDHILKQKNVLRRNTYCCEKCRNDNVLCISCSRAMATCGVLVDSKLCMYCKKEQKLTFEQFWYELRKKKKKFFNVEPKIYVENLKSNLQRESEFRKKAYKEGMLRPFLLLVSMPPAYRLKVANSLGMNSLVNEDFFGDVHHESWHILNQDFYGIQSRSHSAPKKLFLNKYNNCWYEVMRRVIYSVFGDPKIEFLEHEEALFECQKMDSEKVYKLEEEFLQNISDLHLKIESQRKKEIHKKVKSSIETNPSQTLLIRERISSQTGIQDTKVLSYASAVTAANIPALVVSDIVTTTILVEGGVEVTSLGFGAVAAPLLVVGLLVLIGSGIKILIDSSETILLDPLITIMNQRILLAAEGSKIEDFYLPHEKEEPKKNFVEKKNKINSVNPLTNDRNPLKNDENRMIDFGNNHLDVRDVEKEDGGSKNMNSYTFLSDTHKNNQIYEKDS